MINESNYKKYMLAYIVLTFLLMICIIYLINSCIIDNDYILLLLERLFKGSL